MSDPLKEWAEARGVALGVPGFGGVKRCPDCDGEGWWDSDATDGFPSVVCETCGGSGNAKPEVSS